PPCLPVKFMVGIQMSFCTSDCQDYSSGSLWAQLWLPQEPSIRDCFEIRWLIRTFWETPAQELSARCLPRFSIFISRTRYTFFRSALPFSACFWFIVLPQRMDVRLFR